MAEFWNPAGGDRHVLDPQILEFQLHRPPVYADIRRCPAGADELGGHLEGRGHGRGNRAGAAASSDPSEVTEKSRPNLALYGKRQDD